MSYALARPSNASRSGMLGIVIGLHAGILALVLAAKAVAPQIAEIPLIVDLIQPAAEVQPPQAKPQPVVKPQPLPQKATPTPKTSTPALETTRSEVAAPAAPAAPPVESKPQAPATPVAAPLSQARFDADYLNNPAPAYPPLSRRMHEEGKVILRVSVSPEGTAESIEIKSSSGSTRLDESALRTVRNWKFIPAKRAETPVQSWVLVPIIFKLEQ